MTVEQMHEFVVLAEERNYLVAADILYSTQATLSRHIMAMEEELGFQLFNRSTKKIELTVEGSHFLPYARNTVRLQEAYKVAIEQARQERSSALLVGYSFLASFYGFTDGLTQLMTDHPELDIKISQGDSETLLRAVQEGNLDVAFIQENPFEKPRNIEYVRFATDVMVAIMTKDHPLAGRSSLELQELANDRFIFTDLQSEPAVIALEACRRSGFQPDIFKSGLVGQSMYSMLSRGGLVGLDWRKPAFSHTNADERFALVEVSPPIYSNSLIVYRKGHLSPAAKMLINYFESHSTAKEMIEP